MSSVSTPSRSATSAPSANPVAMSGAPTPRQTMATVALRRASILAPTTVGARWTSVAATINDRNPNTLSQAWAGLSRPHRSTKGRSPPASKSRSGPRHRPAAMRRRRPSARAGVAGPGRRGAFRTPPRQVHEPSEVGDTAADRNGRQATGTPALTASEPTATSPMAARRTAGRAGGATARAVVKNGSTLATAVPAAPRGRGGAEATARAGSPRAAPATRSRG